MKPTVILSTVVGLSLLAAGTAFAQPTPAPYLPTDPEAPTEPPPQPQPEPPPPVRIAPPPAPVPMPAPAAAAPMRPTAYSMAIGLGYVMPAELNLPNTTSVRFRLASGLTFEPTFVFGRSTTSRDLGTTNEDDLTDEVGINAVVRYPMRTHNRVDFSLVGGAGFDVVTTNPEGSDNTLRTTAVGLLYGIGLDYWVNQHWNLSMTAANPILRSTKRSEETGAGTPEISTTNTTFGAIFDPTVTVMVHLYL